MAKLGEPLDPGPLAGLAGEFIRFRGALGSRTGRKQHPPAQAWLDQSYMSSEQARECRAAWDALAPWKKARWWLCNLRHGDPAQEVDSSRRGSPFALFSRCWWEQGSRAHRLPVSPCARRMTDPDASPWDFTP